LFFCGKFLADTQLHHIEHIRACTSDKIRDH
jgi:hypothetical protein